jgi:hypothetical protein
MPKKKKVIKGKKGKKGKKNSDNDTKQTTKTSQDDVGLYKLTTLIKMSKAITDVLLVFICYNYIDELKEQYPFIAKIQTTCLLLIELLLSKQNEIFVGSNMNPIFVDIKNFFNTTLVTIRKVIFTIPNMRTLLEKYRTREGLNNIFIDLYKKLYTPLAIIDVFESSDNPNKEALTLSFKFILVMINYIHTSINVILNIVGNIPFIKPLIKSYAPLILVEKASSSEKNKKIQIDILKILQLDFSKINDPYFNKFKTIQEQFAPIKENLDAGKNISQSLSDSLLFSITSGSVSFDKMFFVKQYTNRFKGNSICSTDNDTISNNTPQVPIVTPQVPTVTPPSKIPEPAQSTIQDDKRSKQEGGYIRQKSLHHQLEHLKYSNINNFIDSQSLQGMFLLHNYNKYINS